ncbi:ATP-grasp domain-containing protein [Streptacidiphilus sp. MAP5-3]|uniref:ATP-grasp domain-containing protein n=1 Tax=unclassified Streptacidiphilus TaxID=2643834 RepID=UPI003513CF42
MTSALALLSTARRLGVQVVVASFDAEDRQLSRAIREQVDRLIVVETNNEAALTEVALALHAESPLSGIIPGFEFYVDSVARIAARLGLPGLPVEAGPALRNKATMRATVEAAGLRVPRYAEATSLASLEAAAERVGFPAVLKPQNSAGSVHVSRVNDLAELRRAHQWMLSDTRTDLGRGLDGRMLLEEYIDGPEVSVEGYVDGDGVAIASVTAKLLGAEPKFVEVGHIVQLDLAASERARLEEYVAGVCRALKVTLGPFHCEVRLQAGDPVLIELGARLAGDHICDLVEIATGVSLAKVMLAAYAGLDRAEVAPVQVPRAKCAAIHFFTAPDLTTLSAVRGVAELREAPDVQEVELYLEPGDPIEPAEDFRSRIGHVIYHADSYADALERRHGIAREVRFE